MTNEEIFAVADSVDMPINLPNDKLCEFARALLAAPPAAALALEIAKWHDAYEAEHKRVERLEAILVRELGLEKARRAIAAPTPSTPAPIGWFDKQMNNIRWKAGLVNADFEDGRPFYTIAIESTSTPAPVACEHCKCNRPYHDLDCPIAIKAMSAAPPTRPDVGDARDAEIARLNAIINTPHADDFIEAVSIEAEHQRQRWGAEGEAGKTPADWFWLVGYLAGKALHSHAAGNTEKGEHHIITTAAACANWHRALFGKTDMRPGHEEGLDGMLAPQSSEKEVGETKGGEKGDD